MKIILPKVNKKKDWFFLQNLPIDIISTNTSNWMSSAAMAAHTPEVSVAMAGVPVMGHTWLRLLNNHTENSFVTRSTITLNNICDRKIELKFWS